MYSERIDITPVKLKHQKPLSCQHCYIELNVDYLRYCVDFEADEPVDREDLLQGWEAVRTKIETVILKSMIAGFEVAWSVFNRRWSLYILVVGADDLRTFFAREEDALYLRDKLLKWLC